MATMAAVEEAEAEAALAAVTEEAQAEQHGVVGMLREKQVHVMQHRAENAPGVCTAATN